MVVKRRSPDERLQGGGRGGTGEDGARRGVRLPASPGVDLIARRDQSAVHSLGLPQTWGCKASHTHPPPGPGDHTSEVRMSQGWAPCRGSRGGSSPPLPASGVSGRPSLGWWPPPSRLRLRLHVTSPLRPCLSSPASYKDPVLGFRATPTQEDLISDPSLHHVCRDPVPCKC